MAMRVVAELIHDGKTSQLKIDDDILVQSCSVVTVIDNINFKIDNDEVTAQVEFETLTF